MNKSGAVEISKKKICNLLQIFNLYKKWLTKKTMFAIIYAGLRKGVIYMENNLELIVQELVEEYGKYGSISYLYAYAKKRFPGISNEIIKLVLYKYNEICDEPKLKCI